MLRYGQALDIGFRAVRETGLLIINQIVAIQVALERNNAGLRRQAGTTLKDGRGRVIYTLPQHPDEIDWLLRDLERFINDDGLFAGIR